ncbi:MAG: hypothetical protein O7A98_03895 [Acidobacteria bacterium]|nr:hypothetical protein [Acidobacteriota bacterium]
METSVHDTVDLAEELGDVDEAQATGSLEVASEARRSGLVELLLVGIANTIWAVVGLIVWLPQAVRAVLTATLRTIHAAMTHQSSDRAVAGIKRVSRSYAERFLKRQGSPVWVARRHELRPFRLLGEGAWAVFFYFMLLRWLAPAKFGPVWQSVSSWAGTAPAKALAVGGGIKDLLPPDLAAVDASRLQAGGVLLVASLVGLILGLWLGRRGR